METKKLYEVIDGLFSRCYSDRFGYINEKLNTLSSLSLAPG